MQVMLSLLLWLLPLACTALPQSTAPSTTYPLTPVALPGLPDNSTGIKVHGIAIGALPDWSHENPRDINAALGRSISIIGDYLNVSPNDYSLSQVDYHLPSVVRLARESARPVYAPALLYGASLDTWTTEMTDAVADKMLRINQQGVTVWLRFCFEMNGSWMQYGLDPDAFKKVWIEVTNAIRAKTSDTYMLWAPNIWTGDVGDATQGYLPYWPGEDYVDLAGLSFYSLGYLKSENQPAASDLLQRSFTSFHTLFSPSSASQNRLGLTRSPPLCIAETSAPFYYELPSSSPYYDQEGDTDIAGPLPNLTLGEYKPSLMSPPAEHGDDELYLKASWFVQLTSNATATRFPRLKAVSLFNYLKRGGDETNQANEVLVDFRATSGNQTVENWFRGYMGNQTAYEMGYTGTAASRRASAVVASLALLIAVGLLC
ncbi:glycoside hydrolase superfamily [Leucosporidium creatinivorum]|uniref:Glycoside hydrolase superfamily n=1 Tax=Leucosporidium creatinivorum TaxID=106004 RepID=A0A1Y2FWQ6_9BASI|nr:glycoside hydrolase superfamily [Leucosporidium creatinivorum]